VFALLGLGIVESLGSGTLGATEAVRAFFSAENCQFVRKKLRDETSDEFMSRGVQLPDLFQAVPDSDIQREFQRELSSMKALCMKLLEQPRAVA
jgi:hypothetical protein